MRSVGKIFSFSAAHKLPHHKGQCKELHGHNYKLEVVVTSKVQYEGPEKGMIMDFGTLSTIIQMCVLNKLDHKNLNEIYGNPTAEIMVGDIAKVIQSHLPQKVELLYLKLWETEKCYAEWTAD